MRTWLPVPGIRHQPTSQGRALVYSAPGCNHTLEHRTRPLDSTTHAPGVRERQDSGTATTAGRGVFAHRNPILSFRFAGAFLLRLGVRILSALLVHPPPCSMAWYGLALAWGACTRHRHSAQSNSTKGALPQAVGISARGIEFCIVMPIAGLHGVD